MSLFSFQVTVEALQLWSDEDEVDAVGPGENVKIKLKNVEEEVSFITLTLVLLNCSWLSRQYIYDNIYLLLKSLSYS